MLECDLIMKGGITSGVVYPDAISGIAGRYRLRDIGGTSAGAIGAAFAAAAEYRRQREGGTSLAGFEAINASAGEMGKDLGALFQPSPRLRPLFRLLMAAVSPEQRAKGRLSLILGAFRGMVAAGAVFFLLVLVAAILAGSFWLGVLGAVLAVVLVAGLIGYALYRLVAVELPRHDYGICSGRTMPGAAKPGFGDWIADNIDAIAGNAGPDGRLADPLTVGQLKEHGISVATMTTDLSSKRPYRLPLRSRHHLFSKAEFEQLFSPRVVDYLTRTGGAFRPEEGMAKGSEIPDDLYRLPHAEAFPVALVARLSLSFPGLIRAVPLYRVEYLGKSGSAGRKKRLRRCLFSDGGISSNFPIHFFDALLPRRPTFGIALTAWEDDRHGAERIDLPEGSRQNTNLPVSDITGVGSFLFAILNTAKDWQDTLQSHLPGYADRIVTVRLDNSREGGLNLAMTPEIIGELRGYGARAAGTLLERFDFDQHRYNRAISLLPNIEGALGSLSASYTARPDGADDAGQTYQWVLTEFETRHFDNPKDWRADPFDRLAADLAAIGARAVEIHDDPERRSVREGSVPSFDAQIRLAAIADRVPRNPDAED